MSSYIMHMCISDVVKKKLNLTDKFIYGSILPDLLKTVNNDRQGTHYLSQVTVNDDTRNLPVIDRAVNELDIQDLDIKLGYIAHLVEDLIWFNDFVPTYAKKIEEDKYEYIATKEIKSGKDFGEDMYSDYTNSGAYVIQKTNTNMEELKSSIYNYLENEQFKELIVKNTMYGESADIYVNKFMTKESIDKYIEIATKAVEKTILELIGDK